MRRALVAGALAACGGHAAPDAAPAAIDASAVDGTYTCVTQQRSGGSCDGPLFDDTIQPSWTLALAGTAVTITTIGFDTPTIGCTGGTWTGGDFACVGSWSRSGRACELGIHLHQTATSPPTFTFWVGVLDQQLATCTRP